MKSRYFLGKCDYKGSGRKNCKAFIEYELKDGRFSMTAEIWNPRETDTLCGGQCCDVVAALFPDDKKAAAMAGIWKKYHLNDMKAGSPAQEAFLEADLDACKTYEESKAALTAAGLNPDASCIHEGKPYEYGSAWLKQELPEDVVAKILSWSGRKNPEGEECAFTAWIDVNYSFKATYVGEEERADAYSCAFATKDGKGRVRSFRTEFKQGFGHRKDRDGWAWDRKKAQGYGVFFEFSPAKSAPSAKQVLACLIDDCRAASDYPDFLDFCEAFGYEDIRAGRRVWQACESQAAKMRKFFGAEIFSRLLDENAELPA